MDYRIEDILGIGDDYEEPEDYGEPDEIIDSTFIKNLEDIKEFLKD